MRLLQLLILFLLPLAWSCEPTQPEEAPPHLTVDYFVRYLETERQLKAEAVYFEGDSLRTPQPKNMSGGVSFQGAPMEKRSLPGYGIRYSIARTADFSDQFRFAYRDDDGTLQEQVVAIAPITNFSLNGPLSRARGAALVVEGPPLTVEETLVLLFTDADNKAFSITLSGPASDNTFLLTPAQLADLPQGPAQLYLVRKKRTVEKKPTRTTVAALEFYTHTLPVDILE